jgi:hypothetical protein
MKTKRKITTKNGFYVNPELERKIDAKHQENLKTARNWGMTCAVNDTIKTDTPINVVTDSIHRAYDTMTSDVNKELDGKNEIAQAQLGINKLKAENKVLKEEAKKTDAEHQIANGKLGFVTIPKSAMRRIFFGIFICLFIWFFDAFSLGTAFQSTGAGLGLSLIVGIGVSLAITTSAVLGTREIEKVPSLRMRIIYYSLLGILIGFGVYVLCVMRSRFYHAQNGQDISAFNMMMLNLLAFLGIHLIFKHILTPAFEIQKQRAEAKLKLQEVSKIKAKWDAINKAFAVNRQTILDIKMLRQTMVAYATALEDKISKYYKEAIAEFKKAYIEKAGLVPPCFSEEPLDLNTFFSDFNFNFNDDDDENND